MKSTFMFTLLIMFISVGVRGQEIISTLPNEATKSAKLLFTTQIIKQSYCSGSEMLLKLRKTFKNVGTLPIILDRESKNPHKWRIKRISGKMRKNYEITIAPYFELGEDVRWGQVPEEDLFIILEPNETYSSISEGGIHVRLDDGERINKNGLRGGTYTLQLRVMSWYYSTPLIDEYRQKWDDKGFLWSTDIVSEPMPFEVQKNQPINKCENK